MFKKNKKGQLGDKILSMIIIIVITAAVVGGLIALVLGGFTDISHNLSNGATSNGTVISTGAGVLTILFTTVLPILVAVGLFVAFRRLMKF